MKRLAVVVAGGLALAGCARTGPTAPATPATVSRTIVYQTGPCFGACPEYKVEVYGNHSGLFTGIRHTSVIGQAGFPLTTAQYDAFAAALAPYRPRGGRRIEPGSPDCPRAATDMPSVEVRWGTGPGADRLYFYYGCENEATRALADALGNAPDLLPLDLLLGERP